MTEKRLCDWVVALKGAGDLASGVAWRLHRSGMHRLWMMETSAPLAVRRGVSYCEAVYEKQKTVEGITAVLVDDHRGIAGAWQEKRIPLLVDPEWRSIAAMAPDVVIDVILAKKNLGTRRAEAPLVIGLGPGFEAGRDVHAVIETNRGHYLGRVLYSGRAEANTGIPGNIGGYTIERVLRSPADGCFSTHLNPGDRVEKDAIVGQVDGVAVQAAVGGVIRGLIRTSTPVRTGMKLGDVDPRGSAAYYKRISDKSIAIGGAVLEAVLCAFHNEMH